MTETSREPSTSIATKQEKDSSPGDPVDASLDPPSSSLAQPGDWNAAYDPSSQKWYYFNLKIGQRSWDPPPGWLSSTGPQTETATAAAPSSNLTSNLPGYYYKDAHGIDQGPFSIHQLLQWRGALPMDLPLWKIEENRNGDQEDGVEKEKINFIPLAEVLGDAELLVQWRALHSQITKETTCAAPSATAFETEQNLKQKLLNTTTAEPAAADEQTDKIDFAASLAEAVLAGLPPDDEAVHLSRVAASAGQSLQEVGEWNRKQSAAQEEYQVTALHTSGRGRIQAVGEECESLYADMGSWIDPRKMEEQMKKAATGGKRKMTAAEVKAAKMRKHELKAKKQRAWLME